MNNRFILKIVFVLICIFSIGAASTFRTLMGPANSVDNSVLRFDGNGKYIVQGSGLIIDDSDNLSVPGNLSVSGTLSLDTMNLGLLNLSNIYDVSPVVTSVVKTSWNTRIDSQSPSNVTILPASPILTTNSSFTPDFSTSRVHVLHINGNATVNKPINVTSDMLYHEFKFIFIQVSPGQYTVTLATNFITGTQVSSFLYSTNAGSRSYMTVNVNTTNLFDIVSSSSGHTTL